MPPLLDILDPSRCPSRGDRRTVRMIRERAAFGNVTSCAGRARPAAAHAPHANNAQARRELPAPAVQGTERAAARERQPKQAALTF